VIGYVNGLPLVFIELKRFEVHIDSAYKKNYSDYLDTIPHLFHWNALVVISNGHDAQYGSMTSTREHFYRWKRLDEDDPEPGKDQPLLPILLKGMLDKARLLDIVENFVLFDASEGGTHKIVARNHQYLGVNRVIERLTSDRPEGQGRSEGRATGRVLAHAGLGQVVFDAVSDREDPPPDLGQLHLRGHHRPHRAGRPDRVHLHQCRPRQQQDRPGLQRRRLAQDAAGPEPPLRVRPDPEIPRTGEGGLFERDDIIVISDEAHRTQYGRLALNMRKGLPRAKFLGFTGTPLIDAGEKQLTREVFGDYVSIYDFQRAVADGATLPLFYENRGEKLKIVDPKVSERIAEHIEAARQGATLNDPWTDEKEEKLYRELARDYPILTSPTRLEKVATGFRRSLPPALEGGGHRRRQGHDGLPGQDHLREDARL
jgi:type I restriction enzyme R subunit